MIPPDIDLFTKLKEPLRGIGFHYLYSRKEEVATQVRRINFRCLATGVRDLPLRWTAVVEKRGRYIEGMQ